MTSSKDKIKLVTDAGLPVGVAQIVHADGTYTFGFDPGFEVPKAKSLVKKKQYEDVYKHSPELDLDLTQNPRSLGATTGRMSQQLPVDWNTVRAQWQQQTKWDPMYLNIPRGYGKTASFDAFDRMKAAFLGFNDSAKKAKTGLEELQDANAAWEKKLQAMKEEARLAITDEKVYTFMDQNYLPYNYARKLLEEAYIDALQNEGKTNDTAESAA